MNCSFDTFNIQALNTNDAEAFFNLINDNRQRLLHFFPGTSASTISLEACSNYMIEVDATMESKKYLPYIITDTTKGKYVGLVDFKNIDWRVPKAEMGYLIDQHYEGQGIVTRAADLVIKFAITQYKFRKILCRISPTNPGSVHVAKRLGFDFEGNIRNDFTSLSGEPIDLHYYGRVF